MKKEEFELFMVEQILDGEDVGVCVCYGTCHGKLSRRVFKYYNQIVLAYEYVTPCINHAKNYAESKAWIEVETWYIRKEVKMYVELNEKDLRKLLYDREVKIKTKNDDEIHIVLTANSAITVQDVIENSSTRELL